MKKEISVRVLMIFIVGYSRYIAVKTGYSMTVFYVLCVAILCYVANDLRQILKLAKKK